MAQCSGSAAATTLTGSGYSRSDRTPEDMKEAEAAIKEQWQKDAKAAPLKGMGGTYTDPNGYEFKYGITVPAKLTLSIKGIAQRLHLGKPKGVNSNLHKWMRGNQLEDTAQAKLGIELNQDELLSLWFDPFF